MKFLFITSCTGKKFYKTDSDREFSRVAELSNKNNLAYNWLNSLDTDKVLRARDMYIGPYTKILFEIEKKIIVNNHEIDIFFNSAGYGIVNSEYPITSYDASYSNGSNKISNFIDINEWFNQINQTKISDLLGYDKVIIYLSDPYLKASLNFIKELKEVYNENLIIIRTTKNNPKFIRDFECNLIYADSVAFRKFKPCLGITVGINVINYIIDEFLSNNILLNIKDIQLNLDNLLLKY